MKHLVIGEPLERTPGELASLVAMIMNDELPTKRRDVQADGDTRYWGVDESHSPVLRRLKEFGERAFEKSVGKPPASSLIMVNCTDSRACPNGSGGGWHRDSFQRQYKAFAYLTEVARESQGAFSFIPSSNSMLLRLISLAHRVRSGSNRYDDRTVNRILRAGLSHHPVLLKSGIPFFVDTSLVHRGLPISEGRRIMATLYLFERLPEWLTQYA